MRIKLGTIAQTINVLEQPRFNDPVSFVLDIHSVDEVTFPIDGPIVVVDDIVWPGKEEKEEFVLYETHSKDWPFIRIDEDITHYNYDEDGNPTDEGVKKYTLVLTKTPTPPAPRPPTPEEEEEERLRRLAEAKEQKIAQSKVDLATFLESNPLLWKDGKHYSVTQAKQTQLTSVISLYTIAQQKGEAYDLRWNATGEECVPWTIENLTQLALDIAAYVQPLVSYQQMKEVEVNDCTTEEEVANVEIDYSKVHPVTE